MNTIVKLVRRKVFVIGEVRCLRKEHPINWEIATLGARATSRNADLARVSHFTQRRNEFLPNVHATFADGEVRLELPLHTIRLLHIWWVSTRTRVPTKMGPSAY